MQEKGARKIRYNEFIQYESNCFSKKKKRALNATSFEENATLN